MYGLMSRTGVPSMASRPCTVNVNPSIPSSVQTVTPIRFGRIFARCAKIPPAATRVPARVASAALDIFRIDRVEQEDNLEVGELA